jgi:hypothetical protein
MKRPILFRGYSEALNKWVEGDLVQQGVGCIIYEHILGRPSRLNQVHPDSVGQFTGLVDCNGVKIFEGMLIETPKGIAPVTFELGCFYVIAVSRYRLGGWATDSIKITGNTFKPQ